MAKAKNTYGAMDGFFEEPEQTTDRKMNPESLKNLRPRESGTAQPKAVLYICKITY